MIDPKNELTFVFPAIPAFAQANNTGVFLCDLGANDFKGLVAVAVGIGKQTAGDANSVFTLALSTSQTNNISNAVAYTAAGNVSTTNNAATGGVLSVNTRDALRYVFLAPTVTGGNSPSAPISVVSIGQSEVQPAGS